MFYHNDLTSLLKKRLGAGTHPLTVPKGEPNFPAARGDQV
jgi:hypothetical protein